LVANVNGITPTMPSAAVAVAPTIRPPAASVIEFRPPSSERSALTSSDIMK
jgi:hypothetical protein